VIPQHVGMFAVIEQSSLSQTAQTAPHKWQNAYSVSLDRLAEDVCIVPIVVAQLQLGNVQRHVFFSHLVEGAAGHKKTPRPQGSGRGGVPVSRSARGVSNALALYAEIRESSLNRPFTHDIAKDQLASYKNASGAFLPASPFPPVGASSCLSARPPLFLCSCCVPSA
jgi:hypothetical protein